MVQGRKEHHFPPTNVRDTGWGQIGARDAEIEIAERPVTQQPTKEFPEVTPVEILWRRNNPAEAVLDHGSMKQEATGHL